MRVPTIDAMCPQVFVSYDECLFRGPQQVFMRNNGRKQRFSSSNPHILRCGHQFRQLAQQALKALTLTNARLPSTRKPTAPELNPRPCSLLRLNLREYATRSGCLVLADCTGHPFLRMATPGKGLFKNSLPSCQAALKRSKPATPCRSLFEVIF